MLQFGFGCCFRSPSAKCTSTFKNKSLKWSAATFLKSALTRFTQQVHLHTLTTLSTKMLQCLPGGFVDTLVRKLLYFLCPYTSVGIIKSKQTLHSNKFFIQISLSAPIIWTTAAKYQEAISRTQGRHKSPCSALGNTQTGMRFWNPVEGWSRTGCIHSRTGSISTLQQRTHPCSVLLDHKPKKLQALLSYIYSIC